MTEQDKQALIKHFCERDCGEAAKGCTIMPCHEIELIQEFPTSEADSDTISRAKAIEAIDEIESEIAEGFGFEYEKWRKYFCDLPSAQPDTYWKEQCQSYEQTINKLRESLSMQHEIIRCKDCKYWVPGYITDNDDFIPPKCGEWQQMLGHSSDDYCSLAERREVTT